MDSLSTGRQNGEALSPFYNFPYNFYGPEEPASKTTAPNCCRDANREAESSPGDARPRIGFAAGPGDLAGAHSPGAGGRRRRPGCGRHPREDGGREQRAPHPLSPHTSGPGGGEREQNAEAEPSTPGAGQRVGPSASTAEAAAPGRTASAAGHTHCVTVKRQSSEPGLGPRRIQTCARPLLGRMMAGESFPPFRPQGPRRREEDANITTQR